MLLTSLVVGPLETNCYVLWEEDTLKGAIIDPGGDKDRIVSLVENLGLDVERILLTHGHPDHTFHAGALAGLFGGRIGMHRGDLVQLQHGLGIVGEYFDLADYVAFEPDDLLADGERVTIGESVLTVLHTPGHSEGGLCYQADVGVFCGDTLFAGSLGRTDFPGGSFETLIDSIRKKILVLDDSTRLYPGHGPGTTVGSERRNNPFLA